MLLKNALDIIGDLVEATDPHYGTYIGTLTGIYPSRSGYSLAKVKILACIDYPSQRAIIYTDNLFERKPAKKGDEIIFDMSSIIPYVGGRPDYRKCLADALIKAVHKETGIFKEVLNQHLKEVGLIELL